VGSWFQENLVDTGKLPLFLCAVAFLVTFVVTRLVVRSIKSGAGPLKDNVVGGVHIHHAVPGIVLMVVGGLGGLGAESTAWRSVAGVVFGIGLALVLTRQRFWGRALIDGVVDLPFAISPIVVGLMLIVLYGPDGWLGRWLDPARQHLPVRVVFTTLPGGQPLEMALEIDAAAPR